ncbi:hypothetical protein HWV07_00025 [Natronomonas salina]|uniref:hypothetical protein n=1 Tax=Natronomonas salina TaxID=1710540 RepID=UPI0015B3AFF6|nr:hypothetical protein [Natronomonas salina]QLD87506.1 hypothetical protein HWV07_00025 [Natronomonas salina]
MSDSGPGRREVAYRLFAAEFDDAEFSYSESDEERAPNFVVTPTGARVNRLFAVGVLTEVEDVNPEMVRGRVVDPTGAFVTYAGQYQPDELAFLERVDPPTFLALSGKARTFEPDDGDRIYTSVRPESVSEVDAETRDRWVVTAAERTLERVGIMASAIESGLTGDRLRAALEAEDVDERLADGVALALDYYGTTPAYLEALRETALDAARVVAGEKDEVDRLDVAPDEGMGDAGPLATLELSAPDTGAPADGPEEPLGEEPSDDELADAEPGGEAGSADAEPQQASAGATTESPTTSDPDVETEADAETGTSAAAGAEPDATTETDADPDAGAVSGTDPVPEEADEPDADSGVETGAETETETKTDTDLGSGTEGPTDELEPESATEAAAEPEPDVTPDAAETEPTAESVEGAGQEPDPEDVELDDDFDPGEFELDEEERREVEEEYGTEFSTADEVGSPDATPDVGEEDAETPTEAELAEEAPTEETEADTETEPAAEPEPEPDAETDSEPGSDVGEPETDEASAESAEDVDLEDAVMQTMESIDEGDGADREELVATVTDEYGADPDAVEDAIQDALMSGRCYEPSDGVLKSI